MRRAGVAVALAAHAAAAAAASFCDAAGWKRTFSEDFDQKTLDTSTWTVSTDGPGNSRTRDAQATADSVWLANGSLVLRSDGHWDAATNQWTNLTSGAIQSQHKKSWKPTFRACVRAKLPGAPGSAGQGIWPAHWMMPDDTSCWPCHGEIDIMEMIDGNAQTHGTYHWCLSEKCGNNQAHSGQANTPGFNTDWHEYAVEYHAASGSVSFVLDGKAYHTSSAGLFWDTPYYMILNTAIGGPWPKPPGAKTVLPTYHYVDYVHVSEAA
eukprot:TRINITY_DN4076_c0_g1_i1.p1 TRINITY_DN4076_c0_g1~~TRINITY_DN4076_c0_g1_i1.p1  ORF type:complete len:294 (+),score=93.63 TRINITY_DN4076_c0_g1_i1:85-882(+)